MRKTYSLVLVAKVLLADPDGRHWGYETSNRSGVRAGVLYPILTRMLNAGWLIDGWQDPNTITKGRPRRRYYQLTETGRMELSALLAEAEKDARFAAVLRPSPSC
jgi:PadR family transcriptional regulator, regulatory protein PadR